MARFGTILNIRVLADKLGRLVLDDEKFDRQAPVPADVKLGRLVLADEKLCRLALADEKLCSPRLCEAWQTSPCSEEAWQTSPC
jgi:hypothetical protein